MQNIIRYILDQLFPLKCLGCGVDDVIICDQCLKLVEYKPQWRDFSGFKVWSAFEYNQDLLQKMVRKWKYNADKEILSDIVKMIKFPQISGYDFIVPVPLHSRRRAERGFNQAGQVAHMVNQHFGYDVADYLKRLKYTTPQAQLEREERLRNLKGVFDWKGEDLKGKKILLVDDVVTTGSTLVESGKALKHAGAEEIKGICLFRGG